MRFLAAFLLLLLAACAPRVGVPPEPVPPTRPTTGLEFAPAQFSDLPGWGSDYFAGVLPAFQKSCLKLKNKPGWTASCKAAQSLPSDPVSIRNFLEGQFRPWRVQAGGGNPDGLFTGYYEAEFPVTRHQMSAHQVPLLGPPADLVTADLVLFDSALKGRRIDGRVEKSKMIPYFSRAEIEAGALHGRAPVLAWADAVDAHILSIQGSGRLQMDDGSVMRAGFAGSNGHVFKGIGAILKEKGKIGPGEDSTMPAIERWLRANQAEGRRLMAENPRYIFFRKVEGEGPVGSLGVPLTPERSLAIDNTLLPLGAPIWLATRLAGGQAYQRLMLAQDTGSAIKGAVRGDIFFGTGKPAFEKAGRQKEPGRYWLLLPVGMTPEQAL
ncbi:Membrane-bound lytic murein transglycosylase [Rhodospirillaceae bacterium LM-1]|nr:Membrane-bound lytic murein transglycosylase [Rhodospirillaceae bacterium LM-1]